MNETWKVNLISYFHIFSKGKKWLMEKCIERTFIQPLIEWGVTRICCAFAVAARIISSIRRAHSPHNKDNICKLRLCEWKWSSGDQFPLVPLISGMKIPFFIMQIFNNNHLHLQMQHSFAPCACIVLARLYASHVCTIILLSNYCKQYEQWNT